MNTSTEITIDGTVYTVDLACFWLIHNTKKELTEKKESVK